MRIQIKIFVFTVYGISKTIPTEVLIMGRYLTLLQDTINNGNPLDTMNFYDGRTSRVATVCIGLIKIFDELRDKVVDPHFDTYFKSIVSNSREFNAVVFGLMLLTRESSVNPGTLIMNAVVPMMIELLDHESVSELVRLDIMSKMSKLDMLAGEQLKVLESTDVDNHLQ